ncbi:hypothetical protein FDP41_003902 [Naegleria fowleri]|uniref:Uncharacterized protein n=1 Tax=Naegleria fowleri TaxID=5763 RepID=A0A6A5BWF3_NAEFO|nr:uncharacterized protein FDP41_003902 [Naegleria fowleri]KAF0977249.1 hypothetical protein FDP41_003902 [Naegleria fowleri]
MNSNNNNSTWTTTNIKHSGVMTTRNDDDEIGGGLIEEEHASSSSWTPNSSSSSSPTTKTTTTSEVTFSPTPWCGTTTLTTTPPSPPPSFEYLCDDLYSPLSSPLSSPSIRTLLNSLKSSLSASNQEDDHDDENHPPSPLDPHAFSLDHSQLSKENHSLPSLSSCDGIVQNSATTSTRRSRRSPSSELVSQRRTDTTTSSGQLLSNVVAPSTHCIINSRMMTHTSSSSCNNNITTTNNNNITNNNNNNTTTTNNNNTTTYHQQYKCLNHNNSELNIQRRAFSFINDPNTTLSSNNKNSDILNVLLNDSYLTCVQNKDENHDVKVHEQHSQQHSQQRGLFTSSIDYDGDTEDDPIHFNKRMNLVEIMSGGGHSSNNSHNSTTTTTDHAISNETTIHAFKNSSSSFSTTNSHVIDYYHDLINKLSRLDFGIIYSILSYYLFIIDDWFIYTQLLVYRDERLSRNAAATTTTTTDDVLYRNHSHRNHFHQQQQQQDCKFKNLNKTPNHHHYESSSCTSLIMKMFYGKKYNHLFQVFPSISLNVTNPEFLKYFMSESLSINSNSSNSRNSHNPNNNHNTNGMYSSNSHNSHNINIASSEFNRIQTCHALKSVINNCSHFIANQHFNDLSHLFEFKRLKSFHLPYGFKDDIHLSQLLHKSRKSLESMSVTPMAFDSGVMSSSNATIHRTTTTITTTITTTSTNATIHSRTSPSSSLWWSNDDVHVQTHLTHPSTPHPLQYPNLKSLTLYSKYLNQIDFDKLQLYSLNSLSIYLKYPVIDQNYVSLKNFIQHVVCSPSSSSSSSITDLHFHFNMSHYIQYFTSENHLNSLSLTYCQIPPNYHWNIFTKLNDLTLNITNPLELNHLITKIGHQLKRLYLILDIEEFSSSNSFEHFNDKCPNLQELQLSHVNYSISKHLNQSQSIVRFGCDSALNDLMCIDLLLNIKNLSRLDLKVMVNMYSLIDLVLFRSQKMKSSNSERSNGTTKNDAAITTINGNNGTTTINGTATAGKCSTRDNNNILSSLHLNIECLIQSSAVTTTTCINNTNNNNNNNNNTSNSNSNGQTLHSIVESITTTTRTTRSQSLFNNNYIPPRTLRASTFNSSERMTPMNTFTSDSSSNSGRSTNNSTTITMTHPSSSFPPTLLGRNQFNSLNIHRLELIYREHETISDLSFLTYFKSIEELSIKYGTIYSPLFSQLLSLTSIKKLTLFKTNINHVFLSNKYKVLTFQNIVFIDCHLNSNFLKLLNDYPGMVFEEEKECDSRSGSSSSGITITNTSSSGGLGTSGGGGRGGGGGRSANDGTRSANGEAIMTTIPTTTTTTTTPSTIHDTIRPSKMNHHSSCMMRFNYIMDGYSLHVVGIPKIVVVQDDLHKLQQQESISTTTTTSSSLVSSAASSMNHDDVSCHPSCCIQ